MKNALTLKERRICTRALIVLVAVFALCMNAFAANAVTLEDVYAPIVSLLNQLLGPLLAIVSAIGALYCVILGVKYAKAEEPQDRAKAKNHLKNAIIGFVIIFVLILALNLLLPVMKQWVNDALIDNGMEAIFDLA